MGLYYLDDLAAVARRRLAGDGQPAAERPPVTGHAQERRR